MLRKAIKCLPAVIGLSLTTLATVSIASPASESGTLKKIKDTGAITLGVRDSSIPFAYLDDKQTYQGYSIDLCMKIVAAVQKTIGVAQLDVKMNPVTSSTRIPLMANGTIDLDCASTTNNLDRQKQVAFSPTMFVSGVRLLAKKAANIKTFDDLKGKTVAATSGSTNLRQVTQLNSEKNLGMSIVASKDPAEAFLMVETGRATAIALDDIQLAALAANSKAPGDYAITSQALSVEPYGIMLRKDDPAFKKVVDDAITAVYKSGEINRIYGKWFQAPIPPKGINLNWPITDQLKKVIANPTDSGDPAAYN